MAVFPLFFRVVRVQYQLGHIQNPGKVFETKKQIKMQVFLKARPTIVVVDEAHHAGSNTYKFIPGTASDHYADLSGLTAVPMPTSKHA